jgi:hypothetical protein
MLSWIVRDTVWQGCSSEWVHRHYTISTRTAAEALKIMSRHADGQISVVGFIRDGSSYYYPA